MTSAPHPFARLPEVGDRLDRYELVKKLGAGGMGAVFLGHDREANLRWAIKIIPARTDAETLLRFVREGRAMARVPRHPHVIQVMHAGEAPSCRYLALEFAAGGDLATRLEAGPLDPKAAAALVRDLAGGLAHVHGHGVLHRDIKPANVVFQTDGRALLTDFGLAAVPGGKSLTETGTLMGTPAYMAPEQALCEELDVRTDVYGLGAVLYHALTGRAPYSGGSALALLGKVVDGNPTWPRELVPSIPVRLDAICRKAMAKEPSARYPDATALQDDLAACLASWSEQPPAPSPWVLAVAGVTIAAVVVGLAVVAIGHTGREDGTRGEGPQASSQPSPTPTPTQRAAGSVQLLQAAQAALATGDVFGARARLQDLVRRDPTSAEGWIELAQVHICLSHRDEAIRAAEEARRLLPNDPRPLLLLARSSGAPGARNNPARALIVRARELNAPRHEANFAMSMWEHLVKRNEFTTVWVPREGDPVWTHIAYGSALEKQRRPLDALRFYDRALERQPYNVRALTRRSTLHAQFGALAKAEADLMRALELRPDLPRVRRLEVIVRVEQGRLDGAWRVVRELQRLPYVPPGVVTFLSARIMNRGGKHKEALALLLHVGVPRYGDDDWRLEVARAYLGTRRPKEALKRLAKIKHPDLPVLVRGLALAKVQDFEGAQRDLELYLGRKGGESRESLELQFEVALAQRNQALAQKTLDRLARHNLPPASVAWLVLRLQAAFGIREKLAPQIERCRKLFGADLAAQQDLDTMVKSLVQRGLLTR